MDGFQSKTKAEKYVYPFEGVPEPGDTIEIAKGVHWVRMPLPFSLQWINLWLLEDGDGWTIVDTGIGTEETRKLWREVFEAKLGGRPVTRVIVTHMHPDHIGLSGWITRKFDAQLWTSRLEYMSCRMLIADTGHEAPKDGIRFYREAGWDEDAIENYKARFGGFGRAVSRLPDSFHRLEDGDGIEIGANSWRVITGCGHSPEHVCLYCENLNLLISGDQLLPKISSNVSVFPTEPEANPLKDWLDSCEKLKANVPEDVLVLPAHNEPFYGAHTRLDALIKGHNTALKRLKSRLEDPKAVTDTFSALFSRKIDRDTLSMATGEALAHLNYLLHDGNISRELGSDGVMRYQLVKP